MVQKLCRALIENLQAQVETARGADRSEHILIAKQVIPGLHHRVVRIQEVFRENHEVTHFALLRKLYPVVYESYHHVFRHRSVLERYAEHDQLLDLPETALSISKAAMSDLAEEQEEKYFVFDEFEEKNRRRG